MTATKDDCLFCKILAGDIPSDEVASTEPTYAFRDIQPTAPTHVLVIPREHIDHAARHRARPCGHVLADMFATAQEVARTGGHRRLRATGWCSTSGEDAQNSVPHLHLHVIGGRRMGWPPG